MSISGTPQGKDPAASTPSPEERPNKRKVSFASGTKKEAAIGLQLKPSPAEQAAEMQKSWGALQQQPRVAAGASSQPQINPELNEFRTKHAAEIQTAAQKILNKEDPLNNAVTMLNDSKIIYGLVPENRCNIDALIEMVKTPNPSQTQQESIVVAIATTQVVLEKNEFSLIGPIKDRLREKLSA